MFRVARNVPYLEGGGEVGDRADGEAKGPYVAFDEGPLAVDGLLGRDVCVSHFLIILLLCIVLYFCSLGVIIVVISNFNQRKIKE